MEPDEHPLISLIIILGIITFFVVFGVEASRGCLPADNDVQREIRDDHRRMSEQAIRDAGVGARNTFTGRLYVRPEFEYSDKIPDAADDWDLRRDGGAPRAVDDPGL